MISCLEEVSQDPEPLLLIFEGFMGVVWIVCMNRVLVEVLHDFVFKHV